MVKFKIALCYLLTGLLLSLPSGIVCAQTENDLTAQRSWFKQARAALAAGEMQRFETLYAKLHDYPLTPYLDIWRMQQRLNRKQSAEVVAKLLQRHADIPASTDLHIAWIKSLARRKMWPEVAFELRKLPDPASRIPEICMLSAWHNGDKKAAFFLFSRQWRNGENMDSYLGLKRQWRAAGNPQSADTLARIISLGETGRWQAITPLEAGLDQQSRQWLKLWQKVQQQPEQGLMAAKRAKLGKEQLHIMLSDGLQRLSKVDVDKAWHLLQQFEPALRRQDFAQLQRKVALWAAKRHKPDAKLWLAGLSPAAQDDETRAWQVRLLLIEQNWPGISRVIQAMPDSQKQQHRWLYWQARALQEQGSEPAAELLFDYIAAGRGYYSFLSADHLGLTYRMTLQPAEEFSAAGLEQSAAMSRAYEWLQLEERKKASREWRMALDDASPETWLQALQLSAAWKWHDHAILAAEQAGAEDALELNFPMPYSSDVARYARKSGVQRSLLWGVMRQESIFNPEAISESGARGLMQLMPVTAEYVSQKHGLDYAGQEDLFTPSLNIQLGSLYLSDMLRRFKGNQVLAVAAYNAGPTRVSRWLKHIPFVRPDIWMELIPFQETRHYVQQVMVAAAVYDFLQNKPRSSLFADIQRKNNSSLL